MRVRFLNAEVEQEVRNDEMLFVAWGLVGPAYDWEIDPLHNSSFVATNRANEVELLATLKKRIAALKIERLQSTARG